MANSKPFVPIRYLFPWPEELFRFSEVDHELSMADRVGITGFEFEALDPDITLLRAEIALLDEVSFELPGLNGFELVFGAPSVLATAALGAELNVEVGLAEPLFFGLAKVDIALRMRQDLLRPVIRDTLSRWVPEVGPDGSPRSFEIRLVGVNISVDDEGNIEVAFLGGAPGVAIDAFMIGESGIVVEPDQPVSLHLSRRGTPPPGRSAGWRGVYIPHATIHLPDVDFPAVPAGLEFTDCYIGSGGFSGEVAVNWTLGDAQGSLFDITLSLTRLEMKFEQSTPVIMEIEGQITLPFFDQPLGINMGIGVDGSLSIALSAVQPLGVTYQSGLVTFEKEDLLRLTLDSLVFQVQEGVFTAKLSGQIKPLFGENEGLDWPSFQVRELTIDSDGNVHLDGGWLDLREQYSLDFHGFQMEITKLGFGKTEDGGKWLGFSGALKLVDGLSAGASVEGLRITWYDDDRDTQITFNGVGVEFEVPEVLRFKGAVSYDQTNNEFSGAIKLDLIALDLQVDGQLICGQRNGDNYMAIYLGAELPAGIPLGSTGLALYGMAGLFALDMEPDKTEEQEWYSIDGENSWYHSGAPGVTDLQKWRYERDSLALGAGVTIGTISDNGYAFSGRMLLAIVFPGPILLLEGKANLLQERAKLNGDEPNFRALAVLDNRVGTILIGLDAQYQYDDNGRLIDIRGSAEAFFDNASTWHLYLGEQETREKRIRAEVFQLFEAATYWMLEPKRLAYGTWVGYDENWKFGPLRVTLEAWIESNVAVSRKPVHFHGDLWLHGKAELAVWKFGVGLEVDVEITGDVFDPFYIFGELTVRIKTPWPLPNFKEDITLFEFGPDKNPPPLPLPLQDIAIEHFKVTTSWQLPRNALLFPNYDSDADGFLESADGGNEPSDLDKVPVVPLDCRPHITFGRPVHDYARVGGNPQPPEPEWERIGDPDQNEGPLSVRYGLQEVVLEKWTEDPDPGESWQPVAWSPNPDEKTKLYGSWAPVPTDGDSNAVGQVKLWLWSKTPFDYTRHTGRAWDEWYGDRFSEYPCPPMPLDRELCCDFEQLDPEQILSSPWQCPDPPKLILSWLPPIEQSITTLEQPQSQEGPTHALCFPPGIDLITVRLPQPAKAIKIFFTGFISAVGWDTQGNVYEASPVEPDGNGVFLIEIVGENLMGVFAISPSESELCILKICAVFGLTPDRESEREEMTKHLQDEIARWSQEGDVLEPHTTYRLKILTTVETKDFPYDDDFNDLRTLTEYAYFRTEGPPGLTALSRPLDYPEEAELEDSLDDLTRYVRQTVPATVPAEGEQPPLPRPVYRAYDVGAEFNEDYVDLMYRLERRDLGLYLYDNNNRPVRDAQGRLIVLNNRWGETEDLMLTKSEERWITVVNSSTCVALDPTIIPHHKTLTAAEAGQVLDPDTVYEARLVPLLLHEDFSEDLAGWEKVDEGTNDRPSNWDLLGQGEAATVTGTVVSLDGSPDLSALDPTVDILILKNDTKRPQGRYSIVSVDNEAKTITVDEEPELSASPSAWKIPGLAAAIQTSNIWSGSMDGRDPVKPGTMLLRADYPALPDEHPSQPSQWTDYRFSVYLRSMDDDAMGVVFRYQDNGHYYRFSMDRQRRYRRLVKVIDGTHTILAEDNFVYRQNQDYLITVEAIGSTIRLYQDGASIFDVTDDSLDQGTIGLYCWGNSNTRFSDVRVDDFRGTAPVVYRFQFTTSQFANFFHHLHSFQDETWSADLANIESPPTDSQIADWVSKAVELSALSNLPSDEEARAYEALATAILGSAARQNPPEVQVTRIERNGETIAFLVQSPEPIDWKRTDLEVLRADRWVPRPELPGTVKLTDVTFGTTQPNEESVTLLLREATDLTRYRIEHRRLPGPIFEPTGDPILFADEFEGRDSGLLFREEFGPNALDHYEIVDEGSQLGPSVWSVSDNHIVQTSNIYGGSVSADGLNKPGTIALTGSASWANVRVSITLRSEGAAAIGFVFRYQNADNYYRFAWNREKKYRRLVKKVGSQFSLLWEDSVPYKLGQSYRFGIVAYGERLLGYLDDALLFNVQDPDVKAGRVGFYCWKNGGAHFEEMLVEALELPPVLWQPIFTNRDEVEIVHESEVAEEFSSWEAVDGELHHNWHGKQWSAFESGISGPVRALATSEGRVYVGGEFETIGGLKVNNIAQWDESGWSTLGRDVSSSFLTRSLSVVAGSGVSGTVMAIAVSDGQVYVGGEFATASDGGVSANNIARWDGSNWFALNSGVNGTVSAIAVSDANGSVPAFAPMESPVYVGGQFTTAGGMSANNIARWNGSSWSALGSGVDGTVSAIAVIGSQIYVGGQFTTAGGVSANNIALWDGSSWSALGSGVDGTVSAIAVIGGQIYVGGEFSEAGDVSANNIALWDGKSWSALDNGVNGKVSAIVSNENTTYMGGTFIKAGGVNANNIVKISDCDGDVLAKPGTYALGGSEGWKDVQLSIGLRFNKGAIGGMFRVSPQVRPEGSDESELIQDYDYYRFSMNWQSGDRQLVKKIGGEVTVLWQDTVEPTVGQSYELTIRAVGSELQGYLDGSPLFTVQDGDLKRGRVGLYCWANTNARFERVLVSDRTRQIDRWTIHDEGTVNTPSVWRISNGALLQTSNIYGGSLSGEISEKPGTYAIAGDVKWKDYRLTVRMRSDDDDGIGIMFRYLDEENYYRLSCDAQHNYQRLTKKEDGIVSTLWEAANSYVVGESFTFTIDAIGPHLKGYMDDMPIFDLTDSVHLAGKVGLYSWGNNDARFERVEVRRPPLEAYALFRDRFAEDDLSDWSFLDEGTINSPSNWMTSEGVLRQTSNIYMPPNDRDTLSKLGTQAIAGNSAWTDMVLSARLRSGDNDDIGLEVRYTDPNHYYRFSMDSQRSYRRLVKNVEGEFTLLWEDNFAYEVGRTYEITIVAIGSTLHGYWDGVPMFVVEDSDLTTGQISLYCWGNEDSEFSQVRVYPADRVFNDWLLEEPFDFLIPNRWSFVEEGDQEGPSQWDVIEGALLQTSKIYGGSTDGSGFNKPGTYALAGNTAWTDYRLMVYLSSEDPDGAIGVMFRYQDADNYYRFSMDQQRSYRRLIEKVAGEVTVLWEDAVQYTPGREYVLTIDAIGAQLTGFLDGVQLFSVEDGDLLTGRIGLYCWANTGARFTEVRIAEPIWSPYYTFSPEARLPAGMRVQVYSGNSSEAPPKETGVMQRFIASVNEQGQLQFPSDNLDLRVVEPGTTSGHARRFMPDKDYTPVDDAKVLRKADGTSFFMLVHVASPIEDDITFTQYRLKLEYRRNNKTIDSDSQVFSQIGNSNPEYVTIDVPRSAIP